MSDILSKKDNVALGIGVIVLTVFMMALADAIVKFASSDLPLWQIYVVRSLIAIPIILGMFILSTNGDSPRPKSLAWVMLRSSFLALMYIAIYAGIPILDLSVIAAALYTGPLFTTLFSALLIKEPVGARRWAAILLGFVGVLVVIRPASDEFQVAALIPVLAAIFYALAAIITRSKCADEKPLVMALGLNYALLIMGLGITGLLAFFHPFPALAESYPFLLGNWISLGTNEWGIITALSVLIVGIGLGLAKAYQSAPPAVIATFDYAYIIFAAFWGYIFFAEVPDTPKVVGISLIILSGLLVMPTRKAAAVDPDAAPAI